MYEFSVQERKNKHEFKLYRFYVTCFNWNYALTSNTFSTKLINNIVFRGKLVKIRFTARSFSFIPLIIIINGHIFVYRLMITTGKNDNLGIH